jgi:Arc/MetJ family transcription regulator
MVHTYVTEDNMRTTLDLPEELLKETMNLTHINTKTDVIKMALENLIQKEKIKELKNYFGKIDLEINLDTLRDRR